MQEDSMPLWEVSARALPATTVRAPNWMVAMGLVLEQHGGVARMSMVACERLANGQIIVNDISTGMRLTVRPCVVPEAIPRRSSDSPFLDWMLDCLCDCARGATGGGGHLLGLVSG